MYKIANAIERATPDANGNQPQKGNYPAPKYRN